MNLSRPGAALVLVVAAALITGCAGSPASTPTTAITGGAGAPSSPVATPEATGSPAADAEPTCETIISETAVANFDEVGWTVKEEPFFIGGAQLTGGLQCTWGDYSVPSDNVQVFGWAPITDEQAAAARAELLSSGWRELEEDGAIHITESADTALATDDEGYGLTYLLGDGWVKLADTKQSLLLVEWLPE